MCQKPDTLLLTNAYHAVPGVLVPASDSYTPSHHMPLSFKAAPCATQMSPGGHGEECEACWICLEGADSSEPPEHSSPHVSSPARRLVQPCRCPRVVHSVCLAKWQLNQSGRSEEKFCRFCGEQLPEWQSSLALPGMAAVEPVMSVHFNGHTHMVKVQPGEAGRLAFIADVRRLLGLHERQEFSITFECKVPGHDMLLDLKGLPSYDAAVFCAAMTAVERQRLATDKPNTATNRSSPSPTQAPVAQRSALSSTRRPTSASTSRRLSPRALATANSDDASPTVGEANDISVTGLNSPRETSTASIESSHRRSRNGSRSRSSGSTSSTSSGSSSGNRTRFPDNRIPPDTVRSLSTSDVNIAAGVTDGSSSGAASTSSTVSTATDLSEHGCLRSQLGNAGDAAAASHEHDDDEIRQIELLGLTTNDEPPVYGSPTDPFPSGLSPLPLEANRGHETHDPEPEGTGTLPKGCEDAFVATNGTMTMTGEEGQVAAQQPSSDGGSSSSLSPLDGRDAGEAAASEPSGEAAAAAVRGRDDSVRLMLQMPGGPVAMDAADGASAVGHLGGGGFGLELGGPGRGEGREGERVSVMEAVGEVQEAGREASDTGMGCDLAVGALEAGRGPAAADLVGDGGGGGRGDRSREGQGAGRGGTRGQRGAWWRHVLLCGSGGVRQQVTE